MTERFVTSPEEVLAVIEEGKSGRHVSVTSECNSDIALFVHLGEHSLLTGLIDYHRHVSFKCTEDLSAYFIRK